MHRRHHIRFRYGLAAIFFATSLMPPSFQHAHAGGQLPHAHGHGDPHHHGAHHDHHAFGDDHADEHGLALAVAPTLHAHWTFLMFELTLPIGDESSRRPLPDEAFDQALAKARSAGNDGSALCDSACRVALGCWSLQRPHPGRDGVACRARPHILSPPNLLCDTARHERSGVQLI